MQEGRVAQAADARGLTARGFRVVGEGVAAGLRAGNTYRFADYKEKVIDFLCRVTTVSVETQRIVEAMQKPAH